MVGTKIEYEKYFYFMIMVGAIILMGNLYYYLHPLLSAYGLTHRVVDTLFMKLHQGGVFSFSAKTKFISLILIAPCLLSRTGSLKKINNTVLIAAGAVGCILYFLPAWIPWLYAFTTVTGAGMLYWTLGTFSRMNHRPESNKEETFPQCETLVETSTSLNLPYKFYYGGRMRNGWLNLVAMERGLMVMGNPGSGKSFSIFEPCIETLIKKGAAMLLYDFKYPTLTNFAYNQYLKYKDTLDVKPEFCVINLTDPRTSLRFNPINPDYIRDSADCAEIAEIVMHNINKGTDRKEDFFTDSAKIYFDTIVWFLRCYQNGRYCTLPHVLQMLTYDYKDILQILNTVKENKPKIAPFMGALQGGANEQLQGMLGSSQIPVSKLSSKEIYWVLSGDEGTLDINNPEHPKILCLGNSIDRQSINGTVLALYITRVFREINKPGRVHCGVVLDELATTYLMGLDVLAATGRAYGIKVVFGIQDFSQLVRDYGEKTSEVIFNNVGNIICGQVSGKTADRMSKMMGKIDRTKQSETVGRTNDSINISQQKEDVLPVSKIETLSQGQFFGKIADDFAHKSKEKFFYGELVRDYNKVKEEEKNWKPLPVVRDFGEDEAERKIMSNKDKVLMDHFMKIVLDRNIGYSEDEIQEEVKALYNSASQKKRDSIIKKKVKLARKQAYDMVMDDNYDRIVREVSYIVTSELHRIRVLKMECDPRIYDPTYGL